MTHDFFETRRKRTLHEKKIDLVCKMTRNKRTHFRELNRDGGVSHRLHRVKGYSEPIPTRRFDHVIPR